MLYIYKNITGKPATVLLATKNQDSVGSRTMHPGATISLDYPGLSMYAPNTLSCLIIGNETSIHATEVKEELVEALLPLVTPIVEPIEPIIPVEPVEPIIPIEPSEPVVPIESVTPIEPFEPITPVEPESAPVVPAVVAPKAPVAKTAKPKTQPKKAKK